MFSNYPPSLDPKDTKYTVAELIGNNTEKPYPSAEINSPPGGSINYTTTPPVRDDVYPVVLIFADPASRLEPTTRTILLGSRVWL